MPNYSVVNHSNRLPVFLKQAGAAIARTASLGWKRSVQVIKKPLSFVQRVLVAPIQRRFTAAVKWIKGSHLRIATKVSKATARLRSLVRRKPSAQTRQITQLQQALAAAENAQQTAQEQHAKKEQELQQNLAALEARFNSYKEDGENRAGKAMNALHDRNSSLEEEVSKYQNLVHNQKATLEKQVGELKNAQRDYAAAQKRIADAETAKQAAEQQVARLEKQCAEAAAVQREAKTNYTRSQEELEALKKTLALTREESRALKTAITAKEAEHAEVLAQLRTLEEKEKSLQNALTTAKEQSAALEEALAQKEAQERDITTTKMALCSVEEKLAALQAEDAQHREELRHTLDTVQTLEGAKKELEEQLEALRTELKTQHDAERLAASLEDKEAQLVAAQAQMAQLREQQQAIETSKDKLAASYAAVSSQNDKLTLELRQVKAEIDALKSEESALTAQRTEDAQSIENLKAAITAKEEQLGVLLERAESAEKDAVENAASNAAMQQEIVSLSSKKRELEEKLKENESQLEVLTAQQRASSEQIEEKEQMLTTLTAKCRRLQQQKKDAESTLQALQGSSAEQHSALRALLEKNRNEMLALHNEIEQQQTTLAMLQTEKKFSDAHYTSQLEQQTRENRTLAATLADVQAYAEDATEFLQEREEDRAALHAANQSYAITLREREEKISVLYSQIARLQESEKELEAARTNLKKLLEKATEKNTQLVSDVGSAKEALTAQLATVQEQQESQAAALDALKSAHNALAAEKEQLTEQNSVLQKDLVEERERSAQEQARTKSVQEKLDTIERTLTHYEAEKKELQQQLAQQTARYDALNRQLEEKTAEAARLTIAIANSSEENPAHSAESVQLPQHIEEHEAQYKTLEKSKKEYEAQIEALQNSLDANTTAREELETRIEKQEQAYTADTTTKERRIEALEAQIAAKVAALKEARDKKLAKNAEVALLENQFAVHTATYQETEKKLREDNQASAEKIAELTQTLESLKEEKEELDAKHQQLEQQHRELQECSTALSQEIETNQQRMQALQTEWQHAQAKLTKERDTLVDELATTSAKLEEAQRQNIANEEEYKEAIVALQSQLAQNEEAQVSLRSALDVEKKRVADIEEQLEEKTAAIAAVERMNELPHERSPSSASSGSEREIAPQSTYKSAYHPTSTPSVHAMRILGESPIENGSPSRSLREALLPRVSPAGSNSEEELPIKEKNAITVEVAGQSQSIDENGEQITPEKPPVEDKTTETPLPGLIANPPSTDPALQKITGLNARRVHHEDVSEEMVDVPLHSKSAQPVIERNMGFTDPAVGFSQKLASLEGDLRCNGDESMEEPQLAQSILTGNRMVYSPALRMEVPAADFYRWAMFFLAVPAIYEKKSDWSAEKSFTTLIDPNAEVWKNIVRNLLAHMPKDGKSVSVAGVVEVAVGTLTLLADLHGAIAQLPYSRTQDIENHEKYQQLHTMLGQVSDFSSFKKEWNAAAINKFIDGITEECANQVYGKNRMISELVSDDRKRFIKQCEEIVWGQWHGFSPDQSKQYVKANMQAIEHKRTIDREVYDKNKPGFFKSVSTFFSRGPWE